MTDAILNGNYQINQIIDGGLEKSAARVGITADGAGSGAWSIAASTFGAVGSSGVLTYAVNADGTFAVTTPVGIDYGIIPTGGSVFVLSDTNLLAGMVPPEDLKLSWQLVSGNRSLTPVSGCAFCHIRIDLIQRTLFRRHAPSFSPRLRGGSKPG